MRDDGRMPPPFVCTTGDVLQLLDDLLSGQDAARWDAHFADRAARCPFFVEHPDENLAAWRLAPGRALDLGCGNGRNAVLLAARGWSVDAVDLSAEALAWAAERADAASVVLGLRHGSLLDLTPEPGSYDLSTTPAACTTSPRTGAQPTWSWCAPHWRRAVRAGVLPARGRQRLTDREVYERRTLGGGLGFTEDHLRALLCDGFTVDVLRPMRTGEPDRFGEDTLWALLATRT